MQTRTGARKPILIIGLIVVVIALGWFAWTRVDRPSSNRDISRLADSIKSKRTDLPTASPQTTLGVQAIPGPKDHGR